MLIAANTDIHWLAGFIDGEGSFNFSGGRQGNSNAYKSICISATQNDAWHLEKVVSIVGGQVRRYAYKNNANGKSHFHQWALSGKKAAAIMKLLYPLLSPRRQERINELFSVWKRGPKPGTFNRNKTHCKRGHEFTPENTRTVKSGRECKECSIAYKAKWYKLNTKTN